MAPVLWHVCQCPHEQAARAVSGALGLLDHYCPRGLTLRGPRLVELRREVAATGSISRGRLVEGQHLHLRRNFHSAGQQGPDVPPLLGGRPRVGCLCTCSQNGWEPPGSVHPSTRGGVNPSAKTPSREASSLLFVE